MITQPQKKTFTLYDVMQVSNHSRDIGDKDFDFICYFEASDDPKDYYDKVMLLFALNLEVVSTNESYIICDIVKFIEDNREKFDAFFNEVYSEEWQPQNMHHIDADSEEYYDYYLDSFDKLCIGSFSKDEYEILYKILTR